MHNIPSAPPINWIGHGDSKTGKRSVALATTLALIALSAGAPAPAQEHTQQRTPDHKKADSDKLPVIPNLPVPPHAKDSAKAPALPDLPITPKSSNNGKLPVIPNLPVPGRPGEPTKTVDATKISGSTQPSLDPKVDPKGVLDQALKAYESGQYGHAASILATDLQANPDDGTVHYYMGLALKKQGYDMKALHELEKAARLCPPEMIKRFANEQIGNLDQPEPLEGTAGKGAAPAPSGGDWLTGLGNGINQMFGGKPAPPANTGATATSSGAATSSSGASATNAGPSLSFFPGMPDVMGQIKDAVKQGKKMLRDRNAKEHDKGTSSRSSVDFSRRQIGEAEIMHMDEMQALVQRSHSMNVPDWASNPSGLVAFEQAPENTPEWDYWIGRFKRAFQHVLMRRLNAEATDQQRGAAACIFSVDRSGNLHGQVYASTADPALNKCLVEAVRDLNHSRILAFPTTSRITGWNFQMSWNFGVYLAIVKAYKAQQQREATIQALMKIVQEDTAVKAVIAAGKEKRAKAKKLADEKALKAKLLKPAPEAKVEVAGRVLTPGVERELKAVALELKDLTPVGADATQPNVDPFANINDQTINSWPDLNH
jgi:tetratricopeptide (TPR) repeat protein